MIDRNNKKLLIFNKKIVMSNHQLNVSAIKLSSIFQSRKHIHTFVSLHIKHNEAILIHCKLYTHGCTRCNLSRCKSAN